MSIYVGNKKISKITIGGGGAIVKKAFKGSTLVLGKEIFEYTFTSSGNITLQQTLTSLYVVVVGAGGGCGGANAYSKDAWWTGSGGASGGCSIRQYTADEINNLKGKTIFFCRCWRWFGFIFGWWSWWSIKVPKSNCQWWRCR